MIHSPASSGAKRTIRRRKINPATPLPESRNCVAHNMPIVNDSVWRINDLLSL